MLFHYSVVSMFGLHRIAYSLLSGLSLFGAQVRGAEPHAVDFERDIRPIFQNHCDECHGSKKQKSGLRLDLKANVLRGGDTGKPALMAGNAAESPIYGRIVSADPDEMMPPKGDRLAKEDVEKIRAWIEQGAAWPEKEPPKHWAYVPPQRPALPPVKNSKWVRTPIDRFVLSRLDKEKLKPSPEADRAILLRRVSLDLIGLPPTIAELEQFLTDRRSDAYERAVDRLLASPQYGERWARPWLDLARYADTQGYEKDGSRSMWLYRNWVIDAFNRDLPYDRFTIEQIAGDLLPEATREQKIATGFHRNTMTNTEGGTDDEEFRHDAVVDRVNTTMSVWLGTTFACAQCHNHKYDPFTMKEYYQLFAFLNNTADADREDEKPTLKAPSSEQETKFAQLRSQIDSLQSRYQGDSDELKANITRWETEKKEAMGRWKLLEPVRAVSLKGATLTLTNDGSVLAGGANPSNDVYEVSARFSAAGLTGLRLEVLPDATLPKGSIGRDSNGSFALSKFEAKVFPDGGTNGEPLHFQSVFADYTQQGYNVTNLIEVTEGPGWAVKAEDEKHRDSQSAYFALAHPTNYPAGSTILVRLLSHSPSGEGNLGRFRLWISDGTEPTPIGSLPVGIHKILSLAEKERTDKQRKELGEYYRTIAPELRELREEIAAARKAETELDKTIPRTLVLEELPKPRESHVHIRGSFLSKGEIIQPAVPAALHPLPPNQPANRLTLATWLVDTNNPLTARVAMNRIWEQYFGIGLVESSQDFGTQGDKPSHPELLDWLATEFMRQKWSFKAMHRLIVNSSTYRQSSRVTPDSYQRDPYNRLLARGPRQRLEAEMIRDQALLVSGLLSRKVGGPSVMPPQPAGLWQMVYSSEKWETSPGEDKFRRGLYTFWRRTNPYPMMTTFDAPSREFCVVKRPRSNTPLQALLLLNDPVYVEAAQALARRMLSEGGEKDLARVTYGFRLCVGRPPSKAEVNRLLALARKESVHYADAVGDAEALASQFPALRTGFNAPELAAWTVVANVLLNLDETVTKN